MDNKNSKKGFIEIFKDPPDIFRRFSGWIVATISFVTSLVTFIKLMQGNSELATLISLGLGISILWISFFCIRFWTVTIRQVPGFVSNKSQKKYVYSQFARTLALVVIIIIPLIVAGGYYQWRYFQNLPSKQLIILIADFDGPEQQKYRVTETIIEQLQKATKEYKDVKIQPLKEAITAQQGSEIARAKAIEQKAGLILWGWYAKTEEKTLISVHFEIMQKSGYFPQNLEKQETLKGEAESLDSFTFQEELSHQMNYLIFLTIGLSRFEVGDYRRAITSFNDALAQPNGFNQMFEPSTIYMYRGTSYIFLNRENRYFGYTDQREYLNKELIEYAINDYSQAIRITPNDSMAYYNRGLAYFEKKDSDRAIADCNQAIQIKPDYFEAYFIRGNAFGEKSDHDKAIDSYNQALQINPKDIRSYVNRGSEYSEKGDFDRAIADYSRSIDLNPYFSVAYYNRGRNYIKKGDVKKASSDFETAMRLAKDPTIYYSASEELQEIQKFNIK